MQQHTRPAFDHRPKRQPLLIVLLLLLLAAQPPQAPAADDAPSPEEAAQQAYLDLQTAYLQSDWEQFDKLAKTIARHHRFFSPEHRKATSYARRTAKLLRPKW